MNKSFPSSILSCSSGKQFHAMKPVTVLQCVRTRLESAHLIPIEHHFDSHYIDVKMSLMSSQITSLTIVYSTVYSGTDQTKHQSSASLAFVWGIHRWPVNSPHKTPVTRKMFPFDDGIMLTSDCLSTLFCMITGKLYWGLLYLTPLEYNIRS